jgi:sulfatase maturation enzyme AslB (radical SAM superfamily)
MLGNNCNYNCSYCLDIFKKGDHPFPDDELFLEISKDIIYHYDDLGRDVVFEFMGGEPTLIDKIPQFGKRLHNFPTNITLKTNGSASLAWWEESRRYLTEVIISVHREFADIEHIKNVVQLLQNNETSHPINLTVLFPVTLKQDSWEWGLHNVRKFKKRYGVGELQLLYSNFGRGSNMYLPYKEHQWDQYYKLKGLTRTVDPDPSIILKYPSYKDKTCHAGLDTLVIDSKGNVFRGWCMQGGKIGNIYEMPVDWPKDTIVCKKESCVNGFDRIAQKD